MSPFDSEFVKLVREAVREEFRAAHAPAPSPPSPQSSRSASMLTTAEVGERCGGVSSATVRQWIGKGALNAARVGRTYLVKPAELERFLEARNVAAQPREVDVDEEADNLLARLGGMQ